MSQLYNDIRFAYHSATITFKEYRSLVDAIREQFSYESLIGVKQMSIFDNLTDEQFVEFIDK